MKRAADLQGLPEHGLRSAHRNRQLPEAWLGSIPIHGWYDVRKPLVSTRNLVDIMPLTSIWSGLAVNPVPTTRRTRRRSATARPPAARLCVSISMWAIPATP